MNFNNVKDNYPSRYKQTKYVSIYWKVLFISDVLRMKGLRSKKEARNRNKFNKTIIKLNH